MAMQAATSVNPLDYDRCIFPISGGKDSLACFLHALYLGVPRSKIELWHYDVDGREGSTLFDWPCTRDYCRQLAAAFGVPIYFGWKVGGIEGEILRENALTKPTRWEQPDGTIGEIGGTRGKLNTRLKYPQVAANLVVRWCSAVAKIDVCEKMVRNQPRFLNKRTLIVTGERAEESKNRAHYEPFEIDRADQRDGQRARRHVDRWLAVHAFSEAQVWALVERYRVNPHPAYRLGWGRVSCAACIFGNANQWASLREINPAQVNAHSAYEDRFGRTIHRKLSVIQQADRGTPYVMHEHDKRAALDPIFDEPIIMSPGTWTLPAGAFGDSCGPT